MNKVFVGLVFIIWAQICLRVSSLFVFNSMKTHDFTNDNSVSTQNYCILIICHETASFHSFASPYYCAKVFPKWYSPKLENFRSYGSFNQSQSKSQWEGQKANNITV
ncbi:1573_t:CDS:1 [Dentiscutata heterogama]|uniref:1573_t:CDS:1 n=1 Tax=Dentiscutata heterogama TaxID=1316150 RepID=A0ACA9KQW7_9GLOM|nr:1573_t:CDS:1 [Dentiscutata heterogama]